MNVSPADFDGDGCLDVLIVTGSENVSSSVMVFVYWGNLQSVGGYMYTVGIIHLLVL